MVFDKTMRGEEFNIEARLLSVKYLCDLSLLEKKDWPSLGAELLANTLKELRILREKFKIEKAKA
jgi:hypothetical protein